MENKSEKIDKFTELLFFWNKIHNLTGSKTKDKIKKQVSDSIYPMEYIENIKDIKNILDIGSGAGFPAIPLAIMMPNSNFILTEPLNKKVSFLNMVKIEL
jgi:16S rRNA (guanine527-N7)-methyltransferase